MRNYIWAADDTEWGDGPITASEHADACQRAEAWLTEHEPAEIEIYCRPCHRNELAGLYVEHANGNRQILGCSVPVPEDLQRLTNLAWEHACQTWPEIENNR